MNDKQRALLRILWAALGTSAWVALCGGIAASLGNIELLRDHASFAKFVVMGLALLGGLGTLEGFWRITSAYSFYRDGYRVRWLSGRAYVYEEFGTDGMLRFLDFSYEALAQAYAPPCRIAVPTAETWDTQTPAWVHGRRGEIVSRLTKWAQRGYGPPVTFVSPTDAQCSS